ncbi:MAG: hypothetical protein ACFCVE_04470 [Phycisphaerae bacterium]
MRHLKELETMAAGLTDRSPMDELCYVVDATEALVRRVKALHQVVQAAAVVWIESNGDFCIGDSRYTVGYATTTRCTDVPRTFRTLLGRLDGDVDGLVRLLVSQPFKHGSVKSHLERSDFNSLFTRHRTGKLINGLPPRQLQRRDVRFENNGRG